MPWIKVSELADQEDVSSSTVRRWLEMGLPSKKSSDGVTVIDAVTAADWLEACAAQNPEPDGEVEEEELEADDDGDDEDLEDDDDPEDLEDDDDPENLEDDDENLEADDDEEE